MKSLQIIIILLSVFIVKEAHSQRKEFVAETKSENYYEEIPFEFVKNKIIVPVEIEGKTYRFFLDTGAPNTITREIADRINAKHLKTTMLFDANGNTDSTDIVSVDNLKFGNIVFEHIPTIVSGEHMEQWIACLGLDGCIGSNMLLNSQISVSIHYL
ncbi:MAG: retropepsin-like aspartic protease [Bacteroidales bacterium]